MYLDILQIFIKNVNQSNLILGRWNKPNFKELERKVYLANHDHCGPCRTIKLDSDYNK